MASNLSRLRRDYIDATTVFSLGDRLLPYLPSYKVVDRVGMIPAILALSASLRKGDNCEQVQPDTTRKIPAWDGNAHNAGVGYMGKSTGIRFFLHRLTYQWEWYSWLTKGMKLMTRVVQYHNRVLTS